MHAPPPSSLLEQAIENLSKKVDNFVATTREYYKQVGDSLCEQKSISVRDDQGLDYMEEMLKDLEYETDDIQYFLPSSYATREKGKFPSQPQHNLLTIYEVEVQDGNSSNMLKEQSMVTQENDKQTNQATPSPSYEKEDVKNYEKNEEGIACDDEAIV